MLLACYYLYKFSVLQNKLPQIWQLKTAHIYYPTVTVGREETRHCLAGSTVPCLWRLKSACCLGCRAAGAQGRTPGSCSCWHNSVLCSCRTHVPIFLMAVTQGLLSATKGPQQFFATWPYHNMTTYFFETNRRIFLSNFLRSHIV